MDEVQSLVMKEGWTWYTSESGTGLTENPMLSEDFKDEVSFPMRELTLKRYLIVALYDSMLPGILHISASETKFGAERWRQALTERSS